MCGIVAIISKNQEIKTSQLEAGLDAIAHRGPDGRGEFFNQTRDIALGHVRLAIMDTEGGQQPLLSEDESLILMANGEFYDFERLRHSLISQGHVFKTKSDSEIAVHLFEDQGLQCLEKLRGEFAFIIYDQRKNIITAVRDRFGIKPLFYATHLDQIIIASEIKALFAAGVPALWDENHLNQSLHFAGLESATLYQNVYQVPPGHVLQIKDHKITVTPYWDTNYPKKSELTFSGLDPVKKKLEESIFLRTISDVPMASYLSGGIDSSTVLGMANRLSGKKIPAFTIAFDHTEYDESALAQKMSQFAGSPFHPIRVTNRDFADVFTQTVEKSDLPIYNGHAPARFILSREVKKAGFKVVLGGEGADELFAGYHFSQTALKGSTLNLFQFLRRICSTPDPEVKRIKNLSATLFWAAKALGFPSELAAQLMNRYEHLQDFQTDEFRGRHKNVDPFRKFLRQFPIGENLRRAPFHVILYVWMKSHFPQYVLGAERLDMAHGVELRLPFLDHELFELTKHIPASVLYKEGLNKALLRTIAKDDVCPEVIREMKKPFISPPSTLGNDNPLFTLFCDLLSSQDFKTLRFFDHQHISKLLPKLRLMTAYERAPYDPILYYLASIAVLKQKYRVS